MYNKKQIKVLLSLTLLFLTVNLITGSLNNISDGIVEDTRIDTPQLSWFNNSMNPIYIDASATGVGAQNWTWASSKPWCDGDGSWSNPYILENMSINAAGSDVGILIKNSQYILL